MQATCPVCAQQVTLEEQGKAFFSVAQVLPWFLSYEGLLNAVVKGEFRDSHSNRDRIHWACDDCLEQGRAILANPGLQKFVDCVPYYAYFDLQLECGTCGKRFQFSAKEQQFWYESLKFWVQSWPKDCVECRREKRKRKTGGRVRLVNEDRKSNNPKEKKDG